MSKQTLLIAAGFLLFHVAIILPFVPLVSVLPVTLGALSISAMALSLVLAARWRVVDWLMGGPDKSYRLHRWLGLFALFGVLGHWATASTIEADMPVWLSNSGEAAGEIAMWGLIIMSITAMVKFIPYHLWKASHWLMAPVFLCAVFHTFFSASPLVVGSVPWLLLALMAILGTLSWVQILLRKKHAKQLVTVKSATHFAGGVDIIFTSDKKLPPFRPGQFATIAHAFGNTEAHPFTIAGGAGDSYSRRFVIQAAGDWTNHLVNTIKVGDQFRLGRGVGRFLPKSNTKRQEQLWVAGGAGITPFLAVLEQMQPDNSAPITLLYCIRTFEAAYLLREVNDHAARLPQLKLIVIGGKQITSSQQEKPPERLTSELLADIINPVNTSVAMNRRTKLYLCGPEGLKNMVIKTWHNMGMQGRIYNERFHFRRAYSMQDVIHIAPHRFPPPTRG